MTKLCFADGCTESISRRYLMCLAHWNKVPLDIQRRVYATRRATDRDGIRPYLIARSEAKAAVAELEGHSEIASVIRGWIAREVWCWL